ncbi:amyloid-beta A4 precursor protein-binding family B member 3 isoform X2 [Nerophis ophidion]|uniref:amyloid-beta A4 precursor protein-binding family B member 3 isoform X2 n=1 Tax=Nerophis ophidion TaxID=159077 RepID=UPI002ADF4086|nr:amyloid-beta A4 precursor protein-binding family B member 3 isoform X2 [Nerophis ophidion]
MSVCVCVVCVLEGKQLIGTHKEGGAMMGKDYMLAIIIVNCDDNIWTDQNLLLDQDLPSGWRTIKDSTGTYYWHVPTGTTQWQHPRLNGAPQQPPQPEQQKDHNGSSNCSADAYRAHGAHRYWWSDESCSHDDNSQCFSVRSLGWLQVEEDDLSPGRSSLVVSDVIQQLSRCGGDEQRDRLGSSGEGRDMMLVLKRDTLTLVDALDHAPLYCQPIINIRVWGVGSNNGRDRDFAFVAGDKDSCVLKCHVFRCDAPAKAVAMALHKMCSKMMSGQKATRSLTMESIVPEDLPGQVDYLEAVRQQVQKFDVRYVGSLPVSRAMGMEVLNTAIESIMNATERDQWEASVIHVTDNILSVFKEGEEPFWECQVRLLSFLGVGQDSHTFAVIADGGTQRFECHVFWCEPDAGLLSEAVQAACMVHYQKCLVAQTPPPRTKLWHATPPKIRRANSMDGVAFPPRGRRLHDMEGGGVRRSMMAFFDTFRNKRAAMS